jgi:hypothetical protein
MNTVQIVTIIFLVVTIIDITAVSVYLILFLRDLRTTTQETNDTIKDVRRITGAISSPLATVAGLLENVARGTKAFKAISNFFERNEEKK